MQEFLSLGSIPEAMSEKYFNDMMARFDSVDVLEEMKDIIRKYMNGENDEAFDDMYGILKAIRECVCNRTTFKFYQSDFCSIKVFHGEHSYEHIGKIVEIRGNNDSLFSKKAFVRYKPKKEKSNMFLKSISYQDYMDLSKLLKEKSYSFVEETVLEQIKSNNGDNTKELVSLLYRLNNNKNVIRLAPLSDLYFSTVCDGEKYYIMRSRHVISIYVFLTEAEYAKIKLGA